MKFIATLAVIAVATLSGCASQRINTTTEVPVNAPQVKYIIPAALAADAREDSIKYRYAAALREGSKFRTVYRDDIGSSWGVMTETNQSGVRLSYVHRNQTNTLRHDLIGDFKLTQTLQGQDTVLTVDCPTTMKVDIADLNIGLGGWGSFVKEPEAVADILKLCGGVQLMFSRLETGDFNVSYPDAAVYANFARKLQAHNLQEGVKGVTKDDIAKFKWFRVADGKTTRVLGITVFPYRNGSKVTYRWENTAWCKPNATCDYDPAAAKRMLDTLTNIAND